MERLQELLNRDKFIHHVYGLESHGLCINDIDNLLNKDKFSYVFSRHYDLFKVEDARTIKSLSSEKTEKNSIFIISFISINNESQNTLLKLIEEPKPDTIFFFIFPNSKELLPTLLSRMELIVFNKVLNKETRRIILKDYLGMSLSERFAFIKRLTGKQKKDEINSRKRKSGDLEHKAKLNKKDLQLFLDDLEIFYIKLEASEKRNNILEVILKSRKYMNANGASIRMIIDNISINL